MADQVEVRLDCHAIAYWAPALYLHPKARPATFGRNNIKQLYTNVVYIRSCFARC